MKTVKFSVTDRNCHHTVWAQKEFSTCSEDILPRGQTHTGSQVPDSSCWFLTCKLERKDAHCALVPCGFHSGGGLVYFPSGTMSFCLSVSSDIPTTHRASCCPDQSHTHGACSPRIRGKATFLSLLRIYSDPEEQVLGCIFELAEVTV